MPVDIDTVFADFQNRNIQDNLDELVAGSNKRNFVLENSYYAENNMPSMINAALNKIAKKAGDDLVFDALLESDSSTAQSTTELEDIDQTFTAAQRLVAGKAATLSDRIAVARVFRATSETITSDTHIAKALILAAGYSQKNGATASQLYKGTQVTYDVVKPGLKLVYKKLTAVVSGTETDLIWSTDKWTTATDTSAGVAPTKIYMTLKEYTDQDKAVANFVAAGASTMDAPTPDACVTAVIGDTEALKAAQSQNLQLAPGVGFTIARGNATTSGDLSSTTVDVMKANMSIFSTKPTLAQIETNNTGFSAFGKKLITLSGLYLSEIKALPVDSDLADYMPAAVEGSAFIYGKNPLFRLKPSTNTVSYAVASFYNLLGKSSGLVKFADDLGVTGSSSSSTANGYEKGTKTEATNSAVASISWSQSDATLAATMEAKVFGYSVTNPQGHAESGNSVLDHLRQSSSPTAKIPKDLGASAQAPVIQSFGDAQLKSWISTMLSVNDNTLFAAIRLDAQTHAASEGITQLAYMRNIAGTKTSFNSAPAMPDGSDWPTFVDSEYYVKQTIMEDLIARLTNANAIYENEKFSPSNIAAARTAGVFKAYKSDPNNEYSEVVSNQLVFQANDGANTLAVESNTTDAQKNALAKRIGTDLVLDKKSMTRFVQTVGGNDGSTDLTKDEMKSLIDLLGFDAVEHVIASSSAETGHIGPVLAALASLQNKDSPQRARLNRSAAFFTVLDAINQGGSSPGATDRHTPADAQWVKALYNSNKLGFTEAISDFFLITRGSGSNTITTVESDYFLGSLEAYGIFDVIGNVVIGSAASLSAPKTLSQQQALYISVMKSYLDSYTLPKKKVGQTESVMAISDLLANVDLNFTNAVATASLLYDVIISNAYVKNTEAQVKQLMSYNVTSNCNVLIAVRSLVKDRQMDILDGPDADYDILIARGMLATTIMALAYAESKISGFIVDAVQQTKVYLKRDAVGN